MKTWLHISDLHFGCGQAIVGRMRKALIQYLKKHKPQIDFLFITGDLVYAPKATAEDWNKAKEYVEEIQSILCIEKKNTYIVPGNHDIERNFIREALVEKITTLYDSYDGTIPQDILDGLNLTYDKFKQIYEKICGRVYQRHHFVENADEINIIQLDSALTYSEKNQDRKLILGMKLVDEILEEIDLSKPGIVLAHHSFECLTDGERIALETSLKDNNIILYLCGHEHKALYKDIQIIDQKRHLFEYLCGSDMDRGGNNFITDMDFFIGRLEVEKEEGYIEALRFSRDNRCFLPDIEFSSRQDIKQQDGKHYFSSKK